MARRHRAQPCTIVIKLGTSSIVHETTHQPLLSRLSAIVETVLALKQAGHKVVLVSSGAIGVGLKAMNMESRPKNLASVQALAAIGQGRLIALWDNLFGHFGQSIAQILLTRGDIADRTRYLNAVNTLSELLSMGVVPIVNENDTISVSEIKFGDNDTLSAITASMLHADYLFLLTDVDGLYTTNPRKDPSAQPIESVESVQAIRTQVSTTTLGSSLGTGGMETKLIAAEIATAAGVTTVISHSLHPERIVDIIEYNGGLRRPRRADTSSRTSSDPSIEREGSGRANEARLANDASRSEEGDDCSPSSVSSQSPGISALRPPHTVFLPSLAPLRDLKSWTSHTLAPSGSVIIDAGAHRVLARRESGGRLLPAGVVSVEGTFASGQAVRIMVRKGDKSREAAYVHGADTPLSPMGAMTPSSITEVVQEASALSLTTSASADVDATPVMTSKDLADVVTVDSAPDELVEVGRGLANYNSAQISRVKGMKSSNIVHVLGYADSEYVVENVVIRVSPNALIEQ